RLGGVVTSILPLGEDGIGAAGRAVTSWSKLLPQMGWGWVGRGGREKTGALILRIGTRARYASCGHPTSDAVPGVGSCLSARTGRALSQSAAARRMLPCYRKMGELSSVGACYRAKGTR